MKQQLFKLAVICGIGAAAAGVYGAPSSVTSRAALGGNDFVDWATIGDEGDFFGPSFNASSQDGLGLTVSGATSSALGFERVDQGGTWDGNFEDGAALSWTGFGDGPQMFTIEFDSPVFGAGTQIQNDLYGAFTAFLNAYDDGGNLLHADTFAGNSTDDGDDSAIFIGVLNDVENIAKVEFGIEASGSVAINRLDLVRTITVPEGGEYLGALLALTVLGMGVIRSRI